ncbi:5-(carboxyamino)imidazole ribonucleotide mutase [Helcobacillus massiliensis]|uniref:5-(carboxyamino)imidazole ribonucleotide mutase n=1 Tax=Helcobacillus massiliensis TaxID=521392 RepID=UPI0021A69306|nr:5-(carboxyamino)imidazole ribonucleotide mutase [Helcobacillus massiliensis]MCT1557494.1 5-(carboxyamino)imidazole ribonucleotide mutase [Helcobacillus massiliensis]MCT2036325.1 5-(carboxyamino)imidazole ribonucleotide mutase [Helcobacillus massiliensis]MCT2331933.1 5-(carboxyamino)imidazole ribonucleotide mutase [Helcobacillus massiliensis]MDK7742820.1 5-(carboxyamino)imidazole ribonucleotide mutase [Helcobacillus massiliensis]WOO93470.1 5-(carboxyamino)imidazole ribonucleotide mutase [Hel
MTDITPAADSTASGATGAPDADAAGRPLVGIVMGSDSDYPVMKDAHEALTEFGIECEVGVVSAHRMPEDMIEWGRTAEARGLRVIIAGAGGAAHLPGMLASVTTLPVIGVPVPLKHLDGMDSLLSIVQMPGGVPVATVSVGGAKNAGLLAARILGANNTEHGAQLRERMVTYQQELRELAVSKGESLRRSL